MAVKMTQDEFVARGKDEHGKQYDYSGAVYVDSLTPVKLRCYKHDFVFETTPDNHLHNKGGCPKCRYERSSTTQTGSLDKMYTKLDGKYGDRFCYELAVYVDAKTPILIRCKEHDTVFSQTPDKHLQGVGCPKCRKGGYSVGKPGSIYVLSNGNLTKVGITNRAVSSRIQQINNLSGKNFELIHAERETDGGIPHAIEAALKLCLKVDYKQPTEKFAGYTECYYDADMESIINLIQRSAECIKDYDARYRRYHSTGED